MKATCNETSLSRQTFLKVETQLEKYYNWSHSESWSQTTRVFYDNSFTDVTYKNKNIHKENYSIDTLFGASVKLGSSENLRGRKILIHQSMLTKTDVKEDCILPSKVDIFQSKHFVKGPFEICLTKLWSAKNIVEAEKLQHESKPKLFVSVKLKSQDFIIERNQSSFTVGCSFALFVGSCVELLE